MEAIKFSSQGGSSHNQDFSCESVEPENVFTDSGISHLRIIFTGRSRAVGLYIGTKMALISFGITS
jgi:hypothetical protein